MKFKQLLAFSLLLTFVSITPFSTQAIALDPIKLQLIDEVIENYFFPLNHVTGLGLSIVENNETVLAKGYGYQNIENEILVSNSTLFSIGSISKSFGATIIVKVLNEKFPELGESVLDTPIVNLAPELNFMLSDRYRFEYATFRDLLSHRSCLFSPDLDLLFETVSRAEYKFRTRYQTEACTFRNGFQYNNAMYALVGELIASIANSTIEQMVMEFVQQIGMSQTTYFDVDESYLDLPTMSSSYYRKDNITYQFNDSLLRRVHIGLTAGGILASATDMAQYINFHLNKGKFGDVQIIPEDVISWMYKTSNPYEFLGGKETDDDRVTGVYAYGLGFDLLLYDGYKVMSHGGYWPPYHSGLTFIPAKSTGIFTSTNGPGAILLGMSHDSLHGAIYDILAGILTNVDQNSIQKYFTGTNKVGSSETIVKKERVRGSPSGEKLKFGPSNSNKFQSSISQEELIGLYGNANSGDMNITMVDGSLHMNYGEWAVGQLFPLNNNSETQFTIEWSTDIGQHYYTYGELLPLPVSQLDFSILNSVEFIIDEETSYTFIRNRTLDELPAVPWEPDSCGPVEL